MATGFNMLDPIKATVITPGLNVSGKFAETGIPASIVTRYLVEHGVIVEKTGLYSFFIMFTIGITKGRWNTLVSALQQFKDDYDKNQPMWRILPEFCQQYPRYEGIGLKDLCQQIHDTYKIGDVARVTTPFCCWPPNSVSRSVRMRAGSDCARWCSTSRDASITWPFPENWRAE